VLFAGSVHAYWEVFMHTVSTEVLIERAGRDRVLDEAQLAAAAFLARHSARTLDSYRHDLRSFFNWAAACGLEVLTATRRTSSCTATIWNNAASPRQRSTAAYPPCAGSTASPTSTAGSPPTQPNTSADRRFSRDKAEVSTGSKFGQFLFTAERVDRAHAALAALPGLNGLRVSEACDTNIGDLDFDRRHRTLQIIGKGNKPAVIPLVPRTADDRMQSANATKARS
jgi:integrase/recombinase XerD